VADTDDNSVSSSGYTVVARRYRPKTFDQLVGQEHISQALTNAISMGRVGHAYLFTGARGVGKTSTARIFAKALSTTELMSQEVIDEISSAIDSGGDMDVLEIDGASNRGIEEIRQLRSNVNVRPIRAQYKIYIIDEVHMLTTPAFNALLKTLEEPPEHVKFIFCTTDPNKIPITVLSRCQRFDFVPVKIDAIQQRLQEIAQQEGFEIDLDALSLLARQASGSMRDSQSLLEQVMSFSEGKITAQQVHAMLGTVDEENLWQIIQALSHRNPLEALEAANTSIAAGADAGQLTEQLLRYLRDLMALAVGGDSRIMKFANPSGHQRLKQLADSWGLQTLLSAIQILDETLVRMRASVSAITLLEVALVQISQLEQLVSIPALLESLQSTATPTSHQKKKLISDNQAEGRQPTGEGRKDRAPVTEQMAPSQRPEPPLYAATPVPQASGGDVGQASPAVPGDSAISDPSANAGFPHPPEIDESHQKIRQLASTGDALGTWQQVTRSIEGLLSDYCQMVESAEIRPNGQWHIFFPPGANQPREYCEQANRKALLISRLSEAFGREIQLNLEVKPGPAPGPTAAPQSSSGERTKKFRELAEHPLVKKICDLLEGEIVRYHSAHPTPSATNSQRANQSSNRFQQK
jgi:DNA polymerase-3 subunit gamma/tau